MTKIHQYCEENGVNLQWLHRKFNERIKITYHNFCAVFYGRVKMSNEMNLILAEILNCNQAKIYDCWPIKQENEA